MIVLLPGWIGLRSGLLPLEHRLRGRFGASVNRWGLGLGTGCIRRSAERVAERLEDWLDTSESDEPIDLIGHSMGGLVATYVLKHSEVGARLRTVVTLGTPHRGSPAAYLAPGVTSLLSESLAQMAPDSAFLQHLAAAPVPPASRLVSIAALADGVVPALYARLPRQPRQANRHVGGGSHWGLLFSQVVFDLVARELSSRPARRIEDSRLAHVAPSPAYLRASAPP